MLPTRPTAILYIFLWRQLESLNKLPYHTQPVHKKPSNLHILYGSSDKRLGRLVLRNIALCVFLYPEYYSWLRDCCVTCVFRFLSSSDDFVVAEFVGDLSNLAVSFERPRCLGEIRCTWFIDKIYNRGNTVIYSKSSMGIILSIKATLHACSKPMSLLLIFGSSSTAHKLFDKLI